MCEKIRVFDVAKNVTTRLPFIPSMCAHIAVQCTVHTIPGANRFQTTYLRMNECTLLIKIFEYSLNSLNRIDEEKYRFLHHSLNSIFASLLVS